MPEYVAKDQTQLTYEANVKRIRTEGRVVLDTMLNEALAAHSKAFNAGVQRGELLELRLDAQDVKRLLGSSAQKVLGP